MGANWSNTAPAEPKTGKENELIIAGIGTEYPPTLMGADGLQKFAEKLYPADSPWLKSLLKINKQTGIETRAVLDCWQDDEWMSERPPTIEQVDKAFNKYAPPLTAGAARRALNESGFTADSVTHLVAVTATNFNCPGYDHLVALELGISGEAERTLISGSGCAGGLAALRVGANMATAAQARGRPARVLVVACEISSVNLRAELETAHRTQRLGIGAALFGDGAAAVALCNAAAATEKTPRLYSLVDWCMAVAPDTYDEVYVKTSSMGFLVYLAKTLPKHAAASVHAPLARLFAGRPLLPPPQSLDWALHAGGAAIIRGVQDAVGIPDRALRATSDVYRTRGNTASVTVLAVLDRLRRMGPGSRDVVVCSFGPGLTVEMALLERHV